MSRRARQRAEAMRLKREPEPGQEPGFLRQIEACRRDVDELRRRYPGCFHADGRPIVASARLLPDVRAEGIEQEDGDGH